MSSIKRLFIYIPGLFFFVGNFRYDPSKVLINLNNMWKDVYPINYFEILYIIYYTTFVTKGLLIIYNWGKGSTSRRVKMQSKIIVTTSLITFIIGALTDTIMPMLGINIFSFGIMAFPIAMLGICYAIMKYKMMSITPEVVGEYIMANMNDPVIIIGNDFLIQEANIAAIETIGYGKEEMKGISIQKFIAHSDLNETAIKEFVKAGSIKNVEIELFTKGNKFLPCLVSASSIYNDSKELLGLVCVFHDITERKDFENILIKAHQQLESKVTERTAELKKSNSLLQTEITERKKNEERNQQIVKMEALGTLAGGIAHDFNNILAGIIGYTQLTLEDLDVGSDLGDNLLEVLKLGERAKKLIAQILTFSRKTIIEPHIVDMRGIIAEILKMIRTATSSSIQIKYDFYGNSPFVFADPGEMQQLIMNLCVNAQLAMGNKGGILQVILTEVIVEEEMKIQYQTLNEGKYIKIQVIDNGCGMEKSTIDRIFEPFYTTRGVQGGTGLGLSVVHGIIRSHGGIITVDSQLNKGSTFTVFFPQAKDQLNNESIDEKTTNRSLARILFVDDEESIVNTTEKILQREGYIVTGVLGGKNALKLFRSNVYFFDIVITDQSMPDMTGSDLVEELKSIRPDIAIILCSGYGYETEDEKVKSLNITEFLFKPVSKNQYVQAIEKVMNHNN
jgi:PAS domain S-box-containing protein